MANQINVFVSEKESDPDWDAFVSSLSCGHYVQTSQWSQVKGILGYHVKRIIICRDGRIVAGGQLLIRQFAPFISLAYLPKGPLFSVWDPFYAEAIVDGLKRVSQNNHFLLLAVQPANEPSELKSLLTSHGFLPSWLELAPTATILLDLKPELGEIMAEMKRQTRQNIHRSENEEMIVREGTEADLPTFYQLHLVTSQRQKFTPYPEKYFAQMWRVFSTKGLISLILAEYQGAPVSALLLVSFRDTVIAKNLGWSGQYAERRPNDAVFWGSIQWAKNNGYHYFDFEGIDRQGAELLLCGFPLPAELKHSPDFFKLGYGGKVTLMPQSCYFAPNSIMRWPWNEILGLKNHKPAIKQQFEHFRRRFG
jgi:lipid II:glycine glycyltransferase (peptidoglycan interpeptide bridge formation enzyme)